MCYKGTIFRIKYICRLSKSFGYLYLWTFWNKMLSKKKKKERPINLRYSKCSCCLVPLILFFKLIVKTTLISLFCERARVICNYFTYKELSADFRSLGFGNGEVFFSTLHSKLFFIFLFWGHAKRWFASIYVIDIAQAK